MPAHNRKRGKGHTGGGAPPAPAAQPQATTYDGPPESPSRGRAGAPSTTGASARASSRAGSQTRRDPARDPAPAPVLVRNVDFGGQAYDYYSTVSVNVPPCVEKLGH